MGKEYLVNDQVLSKICVNSTSDSQNYPKKLLTFGQVWFSVLNYLASIPKCDKSKSSSSTSLRVASIGLSTSASDQVRYGAALCPSTSINEVQSISWKVSLPV